MSTASGEDGAFGGVHASSKERRSRAPRWKLWKLTPEQRVARGRSARDTAPRPSARRGPHRTTAPIPSRCWKARLRAGSPSWSPSATAA